MSAVGNLCVILLKFPAQSRTITNTTSARLSLVHIGELVSYAGPLCRRGTFLCSKYSSLFFLSLPFLSKQPASMTIFWSHVLPQIWDSDYATALLSYTNFQFYLFIAQTLFSGVPTAVWEAWMLSVSWLSPICTSPLSALLPHLLLYLATIPSGPYLKAFSTG